MRQIADEVEAKLETANCFPRKTIVLEESGGPEVLRSVDITAPNAGPGECDRAAEEKLHAIPWYSLPFSMAAEAHRIVEQNQSNGRIILEPIRGQSIVYRTSRP